MAHDNEQYNSTPCDGAANDSAWSKMKGHKLGNNHEVIAAADNTRVAGSPGKALPSGVKHSPSESSIDMHGEYAKDNVGINLTPNDGTSDSIRKLGKNK